MTSFDFVIPIAFCLPAILVNLLLLIDSYSTIGNGMIEVKKVRKIFFAGIVESVIYFIEYIFNDYDYFELRTLGIFIETVLYIVNLYYILTYADLIYSKYEVKLHYKKISRPLFLLPILILFLLETANIFYPFMFNILPDTYDYVETPWVFVANSIPMVYIVFSAVNDIKEWRENTHYYNLPISEYFTIVAVGIVLETAFYDFPIIPVSCAISMIILYIRILKRIAYIDSLSGLYTRSHLFMYINGLLSGKRSAQYKIAGIMIDVDRFKYINDTYGHVTGDKAIQIVGNILKQTAKNNGACFRYGGDEFVVILKIFDVSDVTDLIDRINHAAVEFNATKEEKFVLSLSQGYAVYDSQKDSVIEFIEKMDAEMYKNKMSSSNKKG